MNLTPLRFELTQLTAPDYNQDCFSSSGATTFYFADEEGLELSSCCLTGNRSAIELFIHGWFDETRTHTYWFRRPMHFRYATNQLARWDSNSQLPV